MNNIYLSYGILLFSALIASFSQVLLKKSAQKTIQASSLLRKMLIPSVLLAYILLFITTILNSFALREVDLSIASIIESSSYIFVAILGALFLKERLSARKIIGIALVFIGAIIAVVW